LAQIAGDLLITNNSQTISQLVEKVSGKEGVILWK